MELMGNDEATKKNFAWDLLNLGDGRLPIDSDGLITLPFGQMVSTREDLKEKIFQNFQSFQSNNLPNKQYLAERAILAPRNDDVDYINKILTDSFPGEIILHKSVDKTVEEEEAVNYPTEFLSSLKPTGLPPHLLALKKGMPIMLLRNLDTPKLCNGTRLVITDLKPNILEASILSDIYTENEAKVFIAEDSLDSHGSPLLVQATPVSGQTLLLYDHQQGPRTDT